MGANNTLRKVVHTPLLTNNSQNILSFLLKFRQHLLHMLFGFQEIDVFLEERALPSFQIGLHFLWVLIKEAWKVYLGCICNYADDFVIIPKENFKIK